ncbi:hypothetical protein BC826DRAFT_962057, partial [Russula brevipes]
QYVYSLHLSRALSDLLAPSRALSDLSTLSTRLISARTSKPNADHPPASNVLNPPSANSNTPAGNCRLKSSTSTASILVTPSQTYSVTRTLSRPLGPFDPVDSTHFRSRFQAQRRPPPSIQRPQPPFRQLQHAGWQLPTQKPVTAIASKANADRPPASDGPDPPAADSRAHKPVTAWGCNPRCSAQPYSPYPRHPRVFVVDL